MTLTQVTKAGLHDIALDHVFTIGASGSSAYTFQGEGLNGTVNNPTLYLTRGKTYRFENGSGSHPLRIQSTSGASGTAYNTGVTNNAGSGTVIVEVQHDAPDVLYYQCTSHAAMNGILYITGALADGGVTTAKLADDAVTDAKLANSINSAIAANTAKTSLEDDSVSTAKIQDDAVTADKLANSINTEISANTAKTTNATHTGEVTGGTALTIASDVVDEDNLKVSNSPTNGYFLSAQSGNTGGLTWAEVQGGLDGVTTGSGNVTITNGNLVIGTSGKGIDFSATGDSTGDLDTSELLDDYEEGTWTPVLYSAPGGASMNNDTGYYVKVGKLCTIWLQSISLNGNNSSGSTIHVSGIPFSHASDHISIGSARGYGVNMNNSHSWVPFIDSGNLITFGQLDSDVAWTQLKYNNLANTSNVVIQISITYQTT